MVRSEPLTVDPGAVLYYADAVRYDRLHGERTTDLDFYVGCCRHGGGPVLEYGCGTGRLTLALARRGIAVTGVDLSHAMLERLRLKLHSLPVEARRQIVLRRGDMRTVRFRRRFATVVAVFGTFQHLYTLDDVERFLTRVRHHLAPGGHLFFDVAFPHLKDLDSMHHTEVYDPWTQVRRRWANGPESELAERQFFPQELVLLLHKSGFVARCWSDFERHALGDQAARLVVRASPEPSGISQHVRADRGVPR